MGHHVSHEPLANSILFIPDHSGDQKCIDQKPDKADQNEIRYYLQNCTGRSAEIKAMPGHYAKKKPKQVSHGRAWSLIGNPLFNQCQLSGVECHFLPL
ncbi:hypothetical protein MCEMIE4_00025 [Sphingobium cupriresistens]